jgi:hypothetical protein
MHDHVSGRASDAALEPERVGMGHDYGRKICRPGKPKHCCLPIALPVRYSRWHAMEGA